MKEFMTQKELITELVDYLDKNYSLESYYLNIPTTNKCKYYPSVRDCVLSFILEKSNCSILSIHMLKYNGFITSSLDDYNALCTFISHFNEKYKKEILRQYDEATRILTRYLRENNLLGTVCEIYGGKENLMHLIEKRRDFLFLDKCFPFEVTDFKTLVMTIDEMIRLGEFSVDFKKHYTEIIGNI